MTNRSISVPEILPSQLCLFRYSRVQTVKTTAQRHLNVQGQRLSQRYLRIWTTAHPIIPVETFEKAIDQAQMIMFPAAFPQVTNQMPRNSLQQLSRMQRSKEAVMRLLNERDGVWLLVSAMVSRL